MNAKEFQIYRKLKGARRDIATYLAHHPDKRDVDNDNFVASFRFANPDCNYSLETIRRSRQHVQNTMGFMPKKGKAQTWERPLNELKNTNPSQEEMF